MKKPSFLGIFKFTLSSAETVSNNMTYTWRLRKPCESPEKSPCHLGISNTCSKHLHIFILVFGRLVSLYLVLFSPYAFWFQQKCHFQFWFYKELKRQTWGWFQFFFLSGLLFTDTDDSQDSRAGIFPNTFLQLVSGSKNSILK